MKMQLGVLARAFAAMAGATVLSLTAAAPAAAQAVYRIESGTYSTVNDMGGVCSIGPCSPYSLADKVTGTFTVATPFAANLTNFDFGPSLQGFSFDDGAVLYNSTDPRARIGEARVSTDASGNITAYRLVFEVLHGAGSSYPVNDYGDLEARFSYFLYEGGFAAAGRNNNVCLIRSGSSAASGPGTCLPSNGAPGNDIDASSRFTGAATPFTPVLLSYTPPAPVPTMTEWAMILLGVLMAGGAALTIQQRRKLV